MTTAASANISMHEPLSLRQRAGFAASLALAASAFLIIGRSALTPDGPQGAVTLLGGGAGTESLAVAAALSALTAGVATVLAGRRLVDVGTFAVCIGLALKSLRGGTSAVILIAAADGEADGTPVGVATRFALESAGWLVAPLVAVIVSGIVHRRLFGRPGGGVRNSEENDSATTAVGPPRLQPAASDLRLVTAKDSAPHTPWAVGALHTLVASGVALLGIHFFSAGLANRSIQHGQACFVVLAAIFLGTWVAGRIVPVRSALWAILAVPVLATGGYLWASAGASPLPDLPASPFLRILPLQLISVGTATAIGTTWWLRGGDGPERVAASLGESLVYILVWMGLGWLVG